MPKLSHSLKIPPIFAGLVTPSHTSIVVFFAVVKVVFRWVSWAAITQCSKAYLMILAPIRSASSRTCCGSLCTSWSSQPSPRSLSKVYSNTILPSFSITKHWALALSCSCILGNPFGNLKGAKNRG